MDEQLYIKSPEIHAKVVKGVLKFLDKNSPINIPAQQLIPLFWLNNFDTSANHNKLYKFIENELAINEIGNQYAKNIISVVLRQILKFQNKLPDWVFTSSKKDYLGMFKKNGLLVKKTELVKNFTDHLAKIKTTEKYTDTGIVNHRISKIIIPSRNRPDTIAKSVEVLIKTLSSSGRIPKIIVLDDSDTREVSHKYKNILGAVSDKYKGIIHCISKEEREKTVELIAKKSGLQEKLLKDGLIGNPITISNNRLGAVRNFALLLSLNEASLQIDDDVMYRPIRTHSEKNPEKIKFDSHAQLEYNFFNTFESAAGTSSNVVVDLLYEYEKVLMKPVLALTKEMIMGNSPNKELFEAIYSNGLVRAVYAGGRGDSCFWSQYFSTRVETEKSVLALAGDETRYHFNKYSSYCSWGVDTLTIQRDPYCLGMNIAIGPAKDYPPFIQDGIEDGSFGLGIYSTIPNALTANLPITLLHKRDNPHSGDERSFSRGLLSSQSALMSMLDTVLDKSKMKNNDIENTTALGGELISIASEQQLFVESVRMNLKRDLLASDLSLSKKIISIKKMPPWMINDLIQNKKTISLIKNNSKEIGNIKNFLWDIIGQDANQISFEEKIELFRQRILTFGKLLSSWRALIKSAQDCHPQFLL